MDEYLRSRYKKVDGEPDQPARPTGGRYRPTVPERLQRQPARSMFPPKPAGHSMFPVAPAAQPDQPARPAHHPAPHHQPAAAQRNIPAPKPVAVKHSARPKRRFKLVKAVFVLLLVLGLGIGGSYYYLAYVKSPTPVPQKLVQSVGFPLYYPTKLPGAYKFQAGSAYNQKGLFMYKIADGSNGVVINQQAKPTTNFDLSKLPGFQSINVNGGTAVAGTSSGVFTVIYLTPTTLINVTSVNNITRDDMLSIAQNLSPIKRKTGLLQVFNIGFISSGVVSKATVYKN